MLRRTSVVGARSEAEGVGGWVGEMGYVLRVRLASFFAGAAVASSLGLYLLQRDYKIAYDSISQKMGGLHDSMESRISALEKLNQNDGSQHVQAAE